MHGCVCGCVSQQGSNVCSCSDVLTSYLVSFHVYVDFVPYLLLLMLMWQCGHHATKINPQQSPFLCFCLRRNPQSTAQINTIAILTSLPSHQLSSSPSQPSLHCHHTSTVAITLGHLRNLRFIAITLRHRCNHRLVAIALRSEPFDTVSAEKLQPFDTISTIVLY